MKGKSTEEKIPKESVTEENMAGTTQEKQEEVKEISAKEKLKTLLTCGNERVELSAAKEILAMEERAKAESKEAENGDIRLEVVIEII